MTTVYRPIDVLEKQVDLVRWWSTSSYRHGFIEEFQKIVDHYAIIKDKAGNPAKIDEYLISRLDTAETFYVRREIIARLWDFTDAYQAHEHEVVLPQDLPCERGFIYLERPIHILDARGRVMSIKGILWSEEPQGVVIAQFTDARDELDEINRDLYQRWGKQDTVSLCELPLQHINPILWGQRVQNLAARDFDNGFLVELHGDPKAAQIYQENADSYAVSQNRFYGFLISLWEFVQEQIPFRMPADRPMLKRLKRAHSPLSEVTVVELRPVDRPTQHTDPDHVPQTVLWTHRWRSREHKRRWIDKHGNYRETTVSASIKGPEHLPLIEKDRVFHVRK